MLIRYARHVAIVAVLVLAVGSAGRLSPTHAAALPQADVAQTGPDIEGRPPAPGETFNPYGCAATLSREPIDSPAIAEGDLGAAEGPGTAGSGMVNPDANTDCPALPD
jgi:hypothetical protein